MLAMADRKGRVWASVPGLANRARVPLEDTEKALATFLAPDRYSRTPDNEGRRIEPIDGGWQLLNHAKYRDMRDEVVRREYMRDYMKERRKQEKLTVNPVRRGLAKADAEAEADTEADSKALKSKAKVAAMPLPDWLDGKTWTEWLKVRKAKSNTPGSLQAALKKLEGFKAAGHDPNEIVANSLANGWQGLFPPVKARASGTPDYSGVIANLRD